MPAPLRTLLALAVMLLIAACLPTASAYEINEDLSDPIDTSKSGEIVYANGDYNNVAPYHNTIVFRDITLFQELSYVDFVLPGNYGRDSDGNYLQSGRYEFSYQFNDATRPGVIYITRSTNAVGTVTSTKYTIFLNEWDIGDLNGQKSVVLPYRLSSDGGYRAYMPGFWETNTHCDIALGYNGAVYTGLSSLKYQASHTSNLKWQNHLNVTKTTQDLDGYNIELLRTIDNEAYTSTIAIYNNDDEVFVNTEHGTDVFAWFETSEINRIIVTSPNGRNFDYVLGHGETPTDVTVYVRNSQTGAPLADAHIIISASVNDNYHEVINETLPGGTATYTLQPTGGGLPNPDYYRAVATVPGFTQVVENHSFTLTRNQDVIIDMRPDTGGPADPDRCYLEYYVRDLAANPIPAASIQCGNRIKTTNNAGYAIFEVDKNASHSWIAKKSGYTTIEGTATVGPNPRYIVNVVLGPKEIPTNPPATDPGGPGATPTPDRRTNEEKGQAVIDMIADFAEPIALLAIVATVFGLMQMMMPRRR